MNVRNWANWTCPHLGTSRNVSFAVHRSTAGVFRAKVFGARFPTASWGGSADRIAAGANSMRLDADVGLPVLQDQHPDNDTLCLRSGDRTRLAIYSSAVTEGSALSARRIPNSISFVRSPVARYSCHARKARRAAHSSSGVRSAPCMLVGSVQRATWARSSAISYRLRQGPECHVTWTISWEAGAHDPPTLPNSTLTGSPLRVSTPYRPRRRIT